MIIQHLHLCCCLSFALICQPGSWICRLLASLNLLNHPPHLLHPLVHSHQLHPCRQMHHHLLPLHSPHQVSWWNVLLPVFSSLSALWADPTYHGTRSFYTRSLNLPLVFMFVTLFVSFSHVENPLYMPTHTRTCHLYVSSFFFLVFIHWLIIPQTRISRLSHMHCFKALILSTHTNHNHKSHGQ